MDLIATGLAIIWVVEKIVELIKPLLDRVKIPYQAASAVLGGLLAWA